MIDQSEPATMSPVTRVTNLSIHWGLTVRIFAILSLLAGIAVLVTSILGYVQARDTLEDAIYNHLTTAREAKARQVETYFQAISSELRLLAASKLVIDSMRDFRSTFQELNKQPVPDGLKGKLADWYTAEILPDLRRQLGSNATVDRYMAVSPAATYLQYHYMVTNPQSGELRKLSEDPEDGSAYSAAHLRYQPLLITAAATAGFHGLMMADYWSFEVVYGMAKEIDFGTSLYNGPYRDSRAAYALARCAGTPDASAVCLEDFSPYIPSQGRPISFMAAQIIDQGTVIGVLMAELSIEQIDRVMTGDKRWRREGFGATGESYLVGPDSRLRSAPRLFYEDRDAYFLQLEASGVPPEEIDTIRRYGSPVLNQRVDTRASRAALAGSDGVGQGLDLYGIPTLASWGPLSLPGVNWGLVTRINTAEAFAPIDQLRRNLSIVGGLAILVVMVTGAWLARSLLGPLRELTAGAKRFAAGDYETHVAVRTSDEIGALCTAFNGMVNEIGVRNTIIEDKNRENETLLLNILPGPIANRLRSGEHIIADGFAEVTVAFADLVGFTTLTSDMPPQDVVALLNGLFSRFDDAARELGIEKIKTIGDAYMAVSGMLVPRDNHAERMMRMAIRMIHITSEHMIEHNIGMKLRVGINCGPVVAGVIGKSKYSYDLWGDTVNLASRMESSGIPNGIQVTRSVYERLAGKFAFEVRGMIEIKGKGKIETWLLRL